MKKTPCYPDNTRLRLRFTIDSQPYDLGYFDTQASADIAYAKWMSNYHLDQSNAWYDHYDGLVAERDEQDAIEQDRNEIDDIVMSREFDPEKEDY